MIVVYQDFDTPVICQNLGNERAFYRVTEETVQLISIQIDRLVTRGVVKLRPFMANACGYVAEFTGAVQ